MMNLVEPILKLGFKFGDSLDLSFSNNVKYNDIGYYSGYYVPAGQELVCNYPEALPCFTFMAHIRFMDLYRNLQYYPPYYRAHLRTYIRAPFYKIKDTSHEVPILALIQGAYPIRSE